MGSRWKPGHDVVSRRLGDEVVLVDLQTNRISSLNRTGARFWELLAAGRDWDDIRRSLAEEFDVEREQLDRDLEALVRSLADGGFVHAAESRSAPVVGDRDTRARADAPRGRHMRTPRRSVRRLGTASLIVRMGVWSLALPVLKHVLPLPALVRLMSRRLVGTRSPEAERHVVRWARRVYRFRNPGTCLERSLLAYRYLSEASAEPRLIVGMAREDRRFHGHAWVVVDGMPLYESHATLQAFAPLVEFAPDGSIAAMSGEPPIASPAVPRLWRALLGRARG